MTPIEFEEKNFNLAVRNKSMMTESFDENGQFFGAYSPKKYQEKQISES